MLRELVLGAIGVALFVCTASAHVTLETAEARVGAPYKAVLRVPHGCEGTATTAVRVRIPDGMIAVKPMPKPGWKIDTVSGKYSKTYTFFHGAKLSEGVTEVSFTGGKLPDAYYDEFVVTGFLGRRSRSRQDALLPGGAGMRERRASLDRDSSRREIGPLFARACAGAEAVAGQMMRPWSASRTLSRC